MTLVNAPPRLQQMNFGQDNQDSSSFCMVIILSKCPQTSYQLRDATTMIALYLMFTFYIYEVVDTHIVESAVYIFIIVVW